MGRSRRPRLGFSPRFPALCPYEPRRTLGVKQAVAYGARSDTAVAVLEIGNGDRQRSAVSANIIHYWTSNWSQNYLYIPLRDMMLSRKQNKQLQRFTRRPPGVLRFVHATLLRWTPYSRASCHRFGQVQAFPALCPCEPRRSRGVERAVPMYKNLNQ